MIVGEATDDWAEVDAGPYVILLTLEPTQGSSIALTLTTDE